MLIHRLQSDVIEISLLSPYVTAILGPRRVGKSTLLKQFQEKYPEWHWVHFTLDDRYLRQKLSEVGIRTVIEQEAEQKIGKGKKLWVIFDEAQKDPDLFDQIKIIYDDFKDQDKIKFILTGSGVLSLHQLSAESLAGRVELHYLREFGLREAFSLCYPHLTLPKETIHEWMKEGSIESLEVHIQSLLPFQEKLQSILENELIWGGLPEVLNMAENEPKTRYLANYLQTYLEKDVRAIQQISDLNLYEKTMKVMAAQTGSLRDDNKILQSLGCSRDTLKKYRYYIAATLCYEEVYPYISSVLRRLMKSPKGYLNNNGLLSFLSDIYDKNILEKTGLIGHRYENWFLKELHLWTDKTARKQEICYWRTAAGVEVDFVVEKERQIYPFEVTFSKQRQPEKIKHLSTFLAETPETTRGFYIYNGAFQYEATHNICFFPAWAWV